MTDKMDDLLKDYMTGVRQERVPEESIRVVKGLRPKTQSASCPHCGKSITPFKKPIRSQRALVVVWYGAAAISFAVSFFIRQYFYQWLALTLLFGIKAMMDQRAMKTQILIYKAMQEEPADRQRDLLKAPSRL